MRFFALVVILLIALPATASTAPPPPARVFTVELSTGAFVSWTAAEGAESYRVYGITANGTSTLLAETTLLSSVVDTGFTSYAVSSVANGLESDPSGGVDHTCVYVMNDVPFVAVQTECEYNSNTVVRVG